LVLSFYQDGKVGVKYGERPCPVKGVRIDAELKLIRVKYFDGIEASSRPSTQQVWATSN